MIGRRDFIGLLGGAAAAWPLAARAQQPAVPVIGFLTLGSPDRGAHYVAAFHRGLNEIGYVEGRNVAIEYRFAEGRYDRLPALAAELVRRQVAVIVASPIPAALAAKAATATIPIVFNVAGDPVKFGLVASLARPGGNVTGVSFLTQELVPKRIEVLHDLLPKATVIGLLVNPSFLTSETDTRDAQAAAASLGIRLVVVKAVAERDFEPAFEALVQQRAEALFVGSDPFFNTQAAKLVALAGRGDANHAHGEAPRRVHRRPERCLGDSGNNAKRSIFKPAQRQVRSRAEGGRQEKRFQGFC